MKKFLKFLLLFVAVASVVYLLGPAPSAPNLEVKVTDLPDSLTTLESFVNQQELATPNLRPDNQARIVWADSTQKRKTPIAILYIHGFSASQEEGDPVHTDIAHQFGANLYLARLAGHGITPSDTTMISLTADQLVASAENALAVAQQLGDSVIIVATSFGGALALHLASRHPEIKALVLYSPCIAVADPSAVLLDNPWGLQLAKLVTGSETRTMDNINNPTRNSYWTTSYHINGLIALQNFLSTCMVSTTFSKVTCPVLMCYWYKNEQEQDDVVSVPAMLTMFDALGSAQKHKVAIPNVGNHVLASYVLSKDIPTVMHETSQFLSNTVGLTKRF